jgi:hypothetical protein
MVIIIRNVFKIAILVVKRVILIVECVYQYLMVAQQSLPINSVRLKSHKMTTCPVRKPDLSQNVDAIAGVNSRLIIERIFVILSA